ncbi:MAG TPA: hypothetical protein VMF32_13135 [Xanthobacteraceae bacterium]|nr:hypothetical protein [Xanthobacteraceae bacterium]
MGQLFDPFPQTADPATSWQSDAGLRKRVEAEHDPVGRARQDAQQLRNDPRVLARDYRDALALSRERYIDAENARLRDEIKDEFEDAGSLEPRVGVRDVGEIVEHTSTAADRTQIEWNEPANQAIAVRDIGDRQYIGWCHARGAEPLNTRLARVYTGGVALGLVYLAETFGFSLALSGPAVANGTPPGVGLALIFGVCNLFIGGMASVAGSLIADCRPRPRVMGTAVMIVTVLAWMTLTLGGAHYRAIVADGDAPNSGLILQNIASHPFLPWINPLAWFFTVTSLAATVVAWIETVRVFGTPFGHRFADGRRQRARAQLQGVHDGHAAAIRADFARGNRDLDALQASILTPVANGRRLETEFGIIAAKARERITSIARVFDETALKYVVTIRHLRPGADMGGELELGEISDRSMPARMSVKAQVDRLAEDAAVVSAAIAKGRAVLAALEVEHLKQIHARYATAEGSRLTSDGGTRAPIMLRGRTS